MCAWRDLVPIRVAHTACSRITVRDLPATVNLTPRGTRRRYTAGAPVDCLSNAGGFAAARHIRRRASYSHPDTRRLPPGKRVGTADEVAQIVLMLMTNIYLIGEVIRMDGGGRCVQHRSSAAVAGSGRGCRRPCGSSIAWGKMSSVPSWDSVSPGCATRHSPHDRAQPRRGERSNALDQIWTDYSQKSPA